ncbi:uncharacterized protein LOC134240085 [Saccostrea cucullata]|uniref:uncharacterized protein LOC134240085 n=1 Tax=Saccostrea cuccullata TaxID=36930 RepID=UPI002ED26560
MTNKGASETFSKWLMRSFVLMWVALTLLTVALLLPYWATGSVAEGNRTKTVRIGLWNYCENYYDEGSPTQCKRVLDYPLLTEEQKGLLWSIYALMLLVLFSLTLAIFTLGLKMFLLKSKVILLPVSILLNSITVTALQVVILLIRVNLDQIGRDLPGASLHFSFVLSSIAEFVCFVADVMMGIEKLFHR